MREADADGNVFIGTTAGICYADPRMKLHEVPGADLSEKRVLKLDADSDGTIYGQTAISISPAETASSGSISSSFMRCA